MIDIETHAGGKRRETRVPPDRWGAEPASRCSVVTQGTGGGGLGIMGGSRAMSARSGGFPL